MVSVHSVYGLIFGLQAGRPGWYNPFMAPYFVLGAVVSGFSAMILVTAMVRKLFGWESVFGPGIFRGLGNFLASITILYIYFMLAELLTGQYAAPRKDWEVFAELLRGRFAPHFWAGFIGGLVVPFFLLFLQFVRRTASIPLTVVCALAINVGMWVVRSLIVVPTFYHPHLPYHIAEYHPTWVEWVLVLGCYPFAGSVYLTLCKVLPALELPQELRLAWAPRPTGAVQQRPLLRPIATAVTGVALIVAGVSLRTYLPGPVTVAVAEPTDPVTLLLHHLSPSATWVLGIVILVTIPLQICLRKPPWKPPRTTQTTGRSAT